MHDHKNMKCEDCGKGNCSCESGACCNGVSMNDKQKKCGLLILRIVLAIIFIYHGYGKLFGEMPGMTMFTQMVAGMGFPLPALFAYIAALVEFLGGIAMLLGVFTRPAGYLLAIVMTVAIVFTKKFAYPLIEIDLALLAMSLAIALIGPGSCSLMGGKMSGNDWGMGIMKGKEQTKEMKK